MGGRRGCPVNCAGPFHCPPDCCCRSCLAACSHLPHTIPSHVLAAEARRLLPSTDAEQLAAQFEALREAVQPLVGGFRAIAY